MKKATTSKSKKQNINGNLKISSFFTTKEKSKTDTSKVDVVVIDSDDDFVITNPSVINVPSNSNNKNSSISFAKNVNQSIVNANDNNGKTILKAITNLSNEEIKDVTDSPNAKKRKLKSSEHRDEASPPKKKLNNAIYEEIDKNSKPSTCECPETPIGQVLTVKTPDKLLTPTALKEYLTPEKNPFKRTPVKSPASKKLMFVADDYMVSTIYNLKTNKTPVKESLSNPKSSKKAFVIVKTPSKTRKTPKKLFEKSPDKIEQFNVQVIENFVRITPSKSSQKSLQLEPEKNGVTSSEKIQSSILKFMSPKISNKCIEAQNVNEKTPKKESPQINNCSESMVKARTRLDFADTNGDQMSTLKTNIEPSCSNNFNETDDFEAMVFTDELMEEFALEEHILNKASNQFHYSNEVNLLESQHCKIRDIERLPYETVLTLKLTKSKEITTCKLQQFWMHTNLNVGDFVHVMAKKNDKNEWYLNNEFGLLVFEPDHLVSTTSVVNTVFCKRKSVLSDRFHGFEPTNHFMIVGTLVHDLLQSVLKSNARTLEEISRIVKKLVENKDTIRRLYECGMSIKDLEEEIQKFVPRIIEFMEKYVKGKFVLSVKPQTHNKDDWKGTITSIADIEENIWCPELGLKGKVDVTVHSNKEIMPLELKTGRATVSLEHRGQVILYIMMMNKLGYQVPSGLLLYLREGVLREIKMTHKEQRDILMLRNELAYFLTRQPTLNSSAEIEEPIATPPELPEPINHRSCEKCAYNVICASFIRYNKEDISTNKTLQKIQEDALSHISDNHLKYFMHWNSLLAIESNTKKGGKDLRQIYTSKPEERESHGKCIINLKVVSVGEEVNGLYEHAFERQETEKLINFLGCGISENKYVVVSTDGRPAVAAGFVNHVNTKSITVLLDRNLSEKYPNKIFHIDTYDSSSIQTYNMASLTLLLELTPRSEQLRNIIIDKMLPSFETKLPKVIATKGTPILKRLNRVQQRAVLKAIAAKDYLLIKGMPGTGKTTTIVALIQLLTELGKSVVITSHTHAAVDNVCTRLIAYGVKLMRLGAESRIHTSLKGYSEQALTKNCKTPEELELVYNSQLVLAVTCLGSGHPVLSKRVLDFCIVDESTQVLQTSVIRPIYAAKTFILIGDPDQLPAVVRNTDAIKLGMTESIFDRLNSDKATIALNINFRMNKPITDLANCLTYNGELLIGSDSVANATLSMPEKEIIHAEYKTEKWILDSLDNALDRAVVFLDTGPVWSLVHTVAWHVATNNSDKDSSDTSNCVNIYEVAVVVKLVEALLKAGVPQSNIGVIATYSAQVLKISGMLETKNVDVSTVDQFQGKDKNVIIYSCAKSRDTNSMKYNIKTEILEDKRRLNVAITRAKNKLILVGDLSTLRVYSTFNKLLPSIEDKIISLKENEDGFHWEKVLDIKSNFK